MAGLTYDSGALIAAERNDRRLWSMHIRAVDRGEPPVVPTVILAQVWRGGPQVLLSRLLRGCRIEPLVHSAARQAGFALARSGTQDVADAVVVVSAMERGDTLVTSDHADLDRIARGLGSRLNIIDV